jgi:hypothetical protein
MHGRTIDSDTSPRTTRKPGIGLFVVAFMLHLSAGTAESAEVKPGTRVPPLPANHVELGSFLINPEAPVEYVLADVMNGEKKIWWMKKRVPGVAHEGKPVFEIVAAMAAPGIPQGHYLLYGECRQGGKALTDVIAAVRFESGKKELAAVSAWQADVAHESIRPYPSADIVCPGEGN